MLNFGVYIMFPSEVIKKTIWETKKKCLHFSRKKHLLKFTRKTKGRLINQFCPSQRH